MNLYNQQGPLIDRLLAEKPGSIADLGAGQGYHARHFVQAGCRVLAIDRVFTPGVRELAARRPDRCRCLQADLARLPLRDGGLEAIWASHCLEHFENPLAVLREWRRTLRPGGLLAVAVPPYKSQIVGRHVFSGWNVGQLMITLLRAGFAIRNGAYAREGYNVFALVRRMDPPVSLEPNDEILCRHHGLFPPPIEQEILEQRRHNDFGETISCFEGDLPRLGWDHPAGAR